MELTREQAIEEHRKMWNWIADNIEEIRPEFAVEIKMRYLTNIRKLDEPINNHCFCCEYALFMAHKYAGICIYCPLEWYNEENLCANLMADGLYDAFRTHILLKQYNEASIIARQIANLQERKI